MSVGLIWLLCSEYSSKWVPWFIGLGALPHFLLSTKSGELVASWGCLRTVIGSDFFRALIFLFAACFAQQTSKQNLLIVLLLATLVSNIAGALFNTAILSLPVQLVEASAKRDQLTALIDSCFSWGNIIGPAVSVIAYASFGLAGMLAINGASYLLAAILASGITAPQAETAPSTIIDHLTEAKEKKASTEQVQPRLGIFDLLKSQPVISGMLITFLFMNLFLAPLMIFMPWYAKNVYVDGISALAKLEFCFGAGTVAGGMLLSFIQISGRLWVKVSASLLLMSCFYALFTYSNSLLGACINVTFLGFFLAVGNVTCLTFFQTAPLPEQVPQVMGLVNLISVASLPLSMGLIGSFIEGSNVRLIATICAMVVVCISTSIPFIPKIRTI